MRVFNNTVKQLLALDEVSTFYLVQIENPGVLLRDTTAAYDLPVNMGLETYTFSSGNGLYSVEPPRLSTTVDREPYKIVYIDTLMEKRALFETGLVGANVTVYLGFYNTTDEVLGDALPGQPLLNIANTIIVYRGNIDTTSYNINPEEGSVVATMECASPMACLGLTRSFYTSKEAMKLINPLDTSFDQVYVGSKGINLVWGKK